MPSLLAKNQVPHVYAQNEQDFLHELQFYEDIQHKNVNWLLPFKIVDADTVSQLQQHEGKILILPDTEDWFDRSIPKQNLKDIYETVISALKALTALHGLDGFMEI